MNRDMNLIQKAQIKAVANAQNTILKAFNDIREDLQALNGANLTTDFVLYKKYKTQIDNKIKQIKDKYQLHHIYISTNEYSVYLYISVLYDDNGQCKSHNDNLYIGAVRQRQRQLTIPEPYTQERPLLDIEKLIKDYDDIQQIKKEYDELDTKMSEYRQSATILFN